jgi:hypothetical protein
MRFSGDHGIAELLFRLGALCSILVIVLLSWMPGPSLLRTGVLSGREEHFLAYLVSAMLVVAARPRLGLAWCITFYVLLAAVLELGQNFVSGRHPAMADFLASCTGAILGTTLLVLMRRA